MKSSAVSCQFIQQGRLNLSLLKTLTEKPPLFEPGEARFWDDPYIAQRMLEAHLDPTIDAASRRPETIERTVNWLVETLGLKPGDALLDLGCGPGLYCQRFSARGLTVTGVDLSQNSIEYARQHDSATTYICQNYLMLDYAEAFDVTTLIYGDFCVLSDRNAAALLQIVCRALKPGGCFAFDVTTWQHHAPYKDVVRWSAVESGGFWKPGPYLELMQEFDYPEQETWLTQYIVIEDSGAVSVYRNWFHDYRADTITPLLNQQGFEVQGVYGNLTGAPLTPDSHWMGVIARKV